MTEEPRNLKLAGGWFAPTSYAIATLILVGFVADWLIEPDLIARGDDPMFATVLVTMAVILWLAPGAIEATKIAYERVWERGVVEGIDDGTHPDSESWWLQRFLRNALKWIVQTARRVRLTFRKMFGGISDSDRSRGGILGRVDGPAVPERYERFIEELGGRARSGAQWALGMLFFLFAYGVTWMEVNRDTKPGTASLLWFGDYKALHGGLALLTVVLQTFVWILIGVVAWKVLVIALETARFARSFRFKVIIGHPDKGGGMAVLGHMCFRLALIVTVPSFLCAFWVAVLGGEITSSMLRVRYETWESNFRIALGALIVLTLVVAVRPLRGVHRGMLRGRREVQAELDEIALKLDKRTRGLLGDAPESEQADIDGHLKRIESDQKLISELGRFPTWPFDRSTVVKLSASQVVPVLSILGVSGPIVDSIKGILPTLGA